MPRRRHEPCPTHATPKMATVAAIVLLVSVAHVYSYSTGPPVSSNPEICPSMVPAHGGSSQSTTAPYIIAINGQTTSSCYVPGQTITVTLSGTSGATFKGFFMQARLPSATTSSGVFATNGDTNVTPLSCNGGTSNNAIGHNNNNVKTSVSFSWTPPSSLTGTITLTTTIVKDFSTYWVKGVNISLAGCTTTATTTSKITTQPLVTTTRVATTPTTTTTRAATTPVATATVTTTRVATTPATTTTRAVTTPVATATVTTTRVATTPVATTRVTTAPVTITPVATKTAPMTNVTQAAASTMPSAAMTTARLNGSTSGSSVVAQVNVQLTLNKTFQPDYNNLSNPNTVNLTKQLCTSVKTIIQQQNVSLDNCTATGYSVGSIVAPLSLTASSTTSPDPTSVYNSVVNAIQSDTSSPSGTLQTQLGANVTLTSSSCVTCNNATTASSPPSTPTSSTTIIIIVVSIVVGLVVVAVVVIVVLLVTSAAGATAGGAATSGLGALVSAARSKKPLPTSSNAASQPSAADARFAYMFPGRQPRDVGYGTRVMRSDRW